LIIGSTFISFGLINNLEIGAAKSKAAATKKIAPRVMIINAAFSVFLKSNHFY
jgi:hypothetical protein